MGKIIGALTLLTLFSFAFVIVQLWVGRPAVRPVAGSPAPLLEVGPDGSVRSVGTRLQVVERRLQQEEARSAALQARVTERQERLDELASKLERLETEVRRLRLRPSPAGEASQLPAAPPPDPAITTPPAEPGEIPPG